MIDMGKPLRAFDIPIKILQSQRLGVSLVASGYRHLSVVRGGGLVGVDVIGRSSSAGGMDMALRVSSGMVRRGMIAALAFVSSAGAALAQIVPPPGPVAPSMKRLDQLDARRVVSSLPGSQGAVHVISQPGQYMLDRDITCPSGKSAIVVTACGSVSIDLNGFSLHGQSGAIDGVRRDSGCPGGGGGGGSGGFQVFSSKKGYDYYQARSSITGFSRGIATGDVDGDGMADIVVAGVSVESCGQGIVHVHAQNIVHRDLSCRSITGGDAVSVSFDESSGTPGTPSSSSLDSSRVSVDGASGRGMFVSSSRGSLLTISGSNFRSTGAQGLHISSSRGSIITVRGSSFTQTGSHGLHVEQSITVVPVNDPPSVSISDSSASSCGGAAVRLQGGSGLATGKRQHCAISSFSSDACVSAVDASDCGDLECVFVRARGSTGDSFVCRQVGKPKFEDISISGCPSTAVAMRFEDCDDVSGVRVAVGDLNGDGISCTSSGGGLGGGKVVFQDLSLRGPRDSSSGLATGKRGMVLSGLSLVTCVGVSIADVDGDGVSATSCGKATFKEFTVTKKTDTAATASHGLHLTDCDDVDCVSVSISGCVGDGIRHMSTISNAPGTRGRTLAHEAVHVVQCGGSGVHIRCPDQSSTCDVSFSRSSISSCGGNGVTLQCPSSSSRAELRCSSSSFSSCGTSGVRVVANPTSSVSVSMDSCHCVGNTADGLAVVSGIAGATLRGGGEVRCSTTHFRSNGASGCVSENPLYAEQCTFSQNVLHGARVVSTDPFLQIAALDDCVFQRNGAASLSCPRGRFSTVDCRISDGLSHGIESGEGCALLTNTQVQRCGGHGIVTSSSTLYIVGGAVRRNQGAGVVCTGGSFTASDLFVELNGAGSPPGGVNGGMRLIDCPVVSLERCVVSQNTGDGVSCSSITEMAQWSSSQCRFTSNTGNGLSLSNCPAVVTECVSSSNGGTGILLSSTCSRGRVCQCVCSDNFTGGMRVLGTRNVVSSNSATGSATAVAFEIAPNNAACPVVDPSSGASACGPTDNVVH